MIIKRKRLLSGLLVLCMMFTMLPTMAFAEDDTTENTQLQCICTTPCTESEANPDCPVCAENFENCGAEEVTLTEQLFTDVPGDTAKDELTPYADTEVQWGTSEENYSNSGSFIEMQDALSAAASGTTFYAQLAANANSKYNPAQNWTSKTLNLDLAGFTLSPTVTDVTQRTPVLSVENGGTLIVSDTRTDGKITGGHGPSDTDYPDACVAGGGVFVNNGGTFILNSGTITGNSAANGGGVIVAGRTSSFTMNGGTISGNSTNADGGSGAGVCVAASKLVYFKGGTITGNRASGKGAGGVFVSANSGISISGNIQIIGNTSEFYGASNLRTALEGQVTVSDDLTADAKIGIDPYGNTFYTDKLTQTSTPRSPYSSDTVRTAYAYVTGVISYNYSPDNFVSDNSQLTVVKHKQYKRMIVLYPETKAPTASLTSGVYSQAQELTFSSDIAGATIYYTTDGSYPYSASNKYVVGESEPISIDKSMTIRAYITYKRQVNNDNWSDFSNMWFNSPIVKLDYTICSLGASGSELTYGGTLADSVITGIAMEGETQIPGSFAWEDNTIIPTVADSNKTEYNVIFTPDNTDKFPPQTIAVKVKVSPKKLTVPTNDTTAFVYNGKNQIYTPVGFDDTTMDITGNVQENANEAGYSVTVSLRDTNNYVWENDTTNGIDFNFIIKNAGQTAPVVSYTNETIFGKADGKITNVTTAMEYKKQGDKTYTAITGTEITNLAAGTYLVRYAAKTNYNASSDTTVTIEAGDKLTVSIPDKQTGYTLTSSASEVGWNGTVTLTFTVKDGYTFTGSKEITATNGTVVDDGNGSYTVKDIQANTVISVNEVKDITVPTGEIKVTTNSWKEFVQTITFGRFFKDTQDVSITAADAGSGVDKIDYYVSETAMTEEAVKTLTKWTEYTSFSLNANRTYVVYAKLTDKAGNTAYISSDGMVFDNIAPSITGFSEDGVYCKEQTITVTDTNLDKVTLDNVLVTLENGAFTVTPGKKAQTIIATDKAGNSTTMIFPVLKHTKGEWIVDKYATIEETGHRHVNCTVCGNMIQEEVIPKLDDPNAGLVNKDTVVAVGAPETIFNNDVKTLREELLTEDETKRVAGGENAKIYLEVTNIDSTVSEEDKALIEKEAKDEFGADMTLTYIDVSLFKQIGDDAAQKITNPNCPISVTIIIPESIRANGRVFKIVRVHNGVTEIITGQYDAATGAFTFETNQFSTYAIAYHDHSYGAWVDTKDGSHHKKVCACGDEITEEHKWDAGKVTTEATTDKGGVKTYTCSECGATKTESILKKATASQTGDTSNMTLWFVLLLVSSGTLVTIGITKKRKTNSAK